MQRLGSLRDPAAFGGWLAAIARNRATDHFRRAQPTSSLPDELDGETLPAPGRAGPHAVVAPDRLEALAVMAIIRTLPDAYRETLVLRLVEGMTGPEIARHTGLTPGSVRVNLYRGMKLLRERMGASSP
jgi:RNA polymerase sigma-70 factor (ECF subfamily)